jgi:hypothetical protein
MTDAADGRGAEAEPEHGSTTTLDRPRPTGDGSTAPTDTEGPESGAGGPSDAAAAGEGGPGFRYPVHRLRDLDRAGKVWAALFAVALLLAPVLAFAWAAPDWVPASDPALMGFRVLDVGTSATPLTGQPSTSVHYVGGDRPVDHPGPIHFYLMAPFARLFGLSIGMVLTSLLITGGSVLIAAWAIFRQLGRGAGVAAAVALGAVTFTTGASSLVNPVSSNIAGYPLLCSMVLLWCLLCGDFRLLPLAAAVVTFAAQQHLSVLPALTVAAVLTGAAAGWGLWRHRRVLGGDGWRQLLRWGGAAAAVALVLWSPVLLQEVADRPGNITLMAQFAGNDDREPVGFEAAVYQLVHTLGLPPLLFRTNLSGGVLVEAPSPLTWASAGVVVGALVGLGLHWRRRRRRQALLVVSAGIVAIGGLVNGSSVPDSLERLRLPFYHWAWALSVLVLVALALGAAELARAVLPRHAWAVARPAVAALALVALAGPALANPSIDRRSNTLAAAYSPVERSVIAEVVGEVAAHRDELPDDTVMLSRGGIFFEGLPESAAVLLADEGIDLRMSNLHLFFVDDERLTSRDTVDAGVLIVVETPGMRFDPPGELIGEANIVSGFDGEAYDDLVADAEEYHDAAQGEPIEVGPEVREAFPDIPAEVFDYAAAPAGTVDPEEVFDRIPPESVDDVVTLARLLDVAKRPGSALTDRAVLEDIIDHPEVVPYLDPDMARRLLRSLPDEWRANQPLRIQAYLLDREEVLATASRRELD